MTRATTSKLSEGGEVASDNKYEVRQASFNDLVERRHELRSLTNLDRHSDLNLFLNDTRACDFLNGAIAEDDGVIVGWGVLELYAERPVYALYVHHAHRRRGIGHLITETVFETMDKPLSQKAISGWRCASTISSKQR